jgi:hypothetical protein
MAMNITFSWSRFKTLLSSWRSRQDREGRLPWRRQLGVNHHVYQNPDPSCVSLTPQLKRE